MPDNQAAVEQAPKPAVAGAPAAHTGQPPQPFQPKAPGQPAANPWAPPIPPKAAQRPAAIGRFTIHFLVPVQKAPAPHMVSGGVEGLKLPTQLRKFSDAIANPAPSGQAYAPACNPKLASNELNIVSIEPWALLARINNEAVIDPAACEACMATEAWQKAIVERPHPLIREELAPSTAGCCG
jgi:hypothetical protein